MKKLVDAARKAAQQTSLLMTADIRQSAMDSGWSSDIASNTLVMFDGSQYQVSVHSEFEGQAMDLEYGTPTSRPTAVFRKYANNTQPIEKAFVSSLEKELGFKL